MHILDEEYQSDPIDMDLKQHRAALKAFDSTPAQAYDFVMEHMDGAQRALIPAEILESMKCARQAA